MPWGDNGQGNGKGPWGQGGQSGQKPQGGGGQRPPFEGSDNLDEVIEQWQKKLKTMLPGGGNGGSDGEKKMFATFAIIGLVLVLLADMFYIVEEGSRGVVMRFGSYTRTAEPGPHFRLPTPVESVSVVQVDAIRTEEIGFRTSSVPSRRGRDGSGQRALLSESLMLTGDENIVDVNLDVQWNIKDAKAYLFNVRDNMGENTVKSAAESAIRDIIGESDYTYAIEGSGRAEITTKTQDLLRKILDSYNIGVNITSIQIKQIDPPAQVIDTFRDVQTARADKEREINQAEAFSNDILPRAKGDAERLLREAEAYKQEVIAQAEGESQRFLSVYDKYRVAKDVTRRRIYLETMETVLEKVDKILIDDSIGGGVVPYLPLNQLKK